MGLSKGTQGLAEASSKAVGQWCTGPLQASQLGRTGPQEPSQQPHSEASRGGGRPPGRPRLCKAATSSSET